LYYRTLSELNLIRIRQVANQTTGTADERRGIFEASLTAGLSAAQNAIKVNESNYQNWIALGSLYEILVPAPLSVQGAYENAKVAYEEALKRNPTSPEIPLLLARTEVAHGDTAAAREFIKQSLVHKNDYVDAYFLLTQLEIVENNLSQAIAAAEAVALLSPDNPGVFFQLGLLKYNNADYRGAGQALLRAVEIVPDYANAKYFLGLSLYKLGQNDLAIGQFLDLKKSNPDNAEIAAILLNLQNKKDPFFKLAPPINTKPERGNTPPITGQ
jgi:tetratricopeptide (TPR) repeat protein